MARQLNPAANSRRVAAGRRNQAKRRNLTEAGRQRLRATALKNKPWLHSTGPRSVFGKMKSAANGRRRKKNEDTVCEVDAETRALMQGLSKIRQMMATSFPST